MKKRIALLVYVNLYADPKLMPTVSRLDSSNPSVAIEATESSIITAVARVLTMYIPHYNPTVDINVPHVHQLPDLLRRKVLLVHLDEAQTLPSFRAVLPYGLAEKRYVEFTLRETMGAYKPDVLIAPKHLQPTEEPLAVDATKSTEPDYKSAWETLYRHYIPGLSIDLMGTIAKQHNLPDVPRNYI